MALSSARFGFFQLVAKFVEFKPMSPIVVE
jgi:hypothetical protein